MWRGLTADDKVQFDERTKVLKAEYDVKMIAYNKDLALNPRPPPSPGAEPAPKKKRAPAKSSSKSTSNSK